MGISRDKWHKRRKTGARQNPIRMKRKFEIGRPPANTKLGERRVHTVRCRGGQLKFRAIKLDHGNYCWPGEACTRKTRILGVVYNATSNELVRTNTLVKGCIVQIDATPFKNWYRRHYGVVIGKSKQVGTKRSAKGGKESKSKKSKTTDQSEGKKTKTKKTGEESKKTTKKGDTKKTDAKKTDAKKTDTKKTDAKKTDAKKTDAKKTVKTDKSEMQVETKDTNTKAKKLEDKKSKPEKEKPGKRSKERTKSFTARKSKPRDPSKPKKKRRSAPKPKTVRAWTLRNKTRVLEAALADQFNKGRLYAKVSSRPGQVGSADGYILEGEELSFYIKKMNLKKKK